LDRGQDCLRCDWLAAACDILKMNGFHEDDLYYNLEWLANNQAEIEGRLFYKKNREKGALLFLYDVTSSYLEGEQNEFMDITEIKKRVKNRSLLVC
jgi:hypothetical protein